MLNRCISFNRLATMAREDGYRCIRYNMETGEIVESDSMKSVFDSIKSDRHWEYTCKKYPWKCEGNENTTLFLCYKVATSSGHFYTVFFDIENGRIINRGIKDLSKEYAETFPELFDMTVIE